MYSHRPDYRLLVPRRLELPLYPDRQSQCQAQDPARNLVKYLYPEDRQAFLEYQGRTLPRRPVTSALNSHTSPRSY